MASSRISSVQSSHSVVSDSVTPWTTACQASLSITNSWSLPKLKSIESAMPSNHLIVYCPLLRIRWPKFWSFSFNISPSNEHPGLISFRMDWLDLLAVQGTLKSLLQHHSSKVSVLWHSASLWYNSHIHTWLLEKTIALIRQTFVGELMSLLFNMLSRLVITFLPRKASFNFMAAITICSDFGAPQNEVSYHFPIYLPWSDGTTCHECWALSQLFHSPLLLSSGGFLVPSIV